MTSEIAEQATDMTSRYNPGEVEKRWYRVWEERGYFKPDLQSDAAPFVITIPPPNVTGELHLGHALTYGLEDILARFRRMQGYNTLVVPGMDHAGIATQNVVEKQLAGEGISRHDLGRDAFVERVWAWREKYGSAIKRQLQALGCSFDWSRERFTMDPGYVDAVLEFFIRLYEEGKIYRGWRVINWCVRCHSAISDIEVDDVEREDMLYFLRYPLADGDGDIVVATVRPETILGDVAIAVHPGDDRYTGLVGRKALLPILGRELEIVADEMVDREFGSGAVKITPAHDFADFEVAERHGLPMPIAIDENGRITDIGAPYQGMDVAETRRKIVGDLDASGNLVRTEPYRHNVPTCDRCGTLLEPLLSEQWFVRMRELAAPAIEAVRDGSVRFVPDRWANVYLDWMENIRDWTISRQLWWGHRIPIYYCADGHPVAAKSRPDACGQCGGDIVRQDEDVLDTWFSSALWPFATLGWPMETEDLDRFYTTSFMNTSSQIIYLWIARMIMTGIKFMHAPPFPIVLINPTILNREGQRMSKSLGTGVDPLEAIETFGADALRFALFTSGSTQQQEIRFAMERVEQARNFTNKLWNVARFVLGSQTREDEGIELLPPDRWILSRLNAVIESVTADMNRYEFSAAGLRLQDFVWNELADWYVEIAKLRLYDETNPIGRSTVRAVLWSVLDRVDRLLQPFMPFETEEIWQYLRTSGSPAARSLSGWQADLAESVMIAPWPGAAGRDEAVEGELDLVMDIVRAVRAARSEHGVAPAKFLPASIYTQSSTAIDGSLPILERLARLGPTTVTRDAGQVVSSDVVSILVGDVTVSIPLAEMTDIEAEKSRLERELQEAIRMQEGVDVKLANQAFVERAPAAVVDRERNRRAELQDRIERLRVRLEALSS